jgi:hypothetical protein
MLMVTMSPTSAPAVLRAVISAFAPPPPKVEQVSLAAQLSHSGSIFVTTSAMRPWIALTTPVLVNTSPMFPYSRACPNL